MCSLGVVQSKGAKAEGSHADKGKKNTTPEELESSIFATGKRRLTIRPRSKSIVSNAVAERWLGTHAISLGQVAQK